MVGSRGTLRSIGATAFTLAVLIVGCSSMAGCSNADPVDPPGTHVGNTTSEAPGTSDVSPTTVPPSIVPSTTGGPGTTSTTVPVPRSVDANGFDDRTVPEIASRDEFFALAREGVGEHSVAKFVIPDMRNNDTVHWFDSNFYRLHDEWYWFRLLNGQPVPAATARPVDGLSFVTIEQIYDWAAELPDGDLPLDLAWLDTSTSTNTRLASVAFYDLQRTRLRNYGMGSVVHVPASSGFEERWLIELQYSDTPSEAEMQRFFDVLAGSLPDGIGDNLTWVVRSPEQEELARRFEADGVGFADRITRFSELVEPGESAVYNQGIAAGRLRWIGDGGSALSAARPEDILIMEHVPDFLPQGVALLTDNPQTPLAHVNLLARNRGIPNASVAGIADDPAIRQAARVRGYAAVVAHDDEVELILLTREQYDAWNDLQRIDEVAVTGTPVPDAPLVVDLDELVDVAANDADLAAWRVTIGGKATGFLHLLAAGAPTPPDAVAISVAAYDEHLAHLRPTLDAILDDRDFRTNVAARFLLLEGPDDYDSHFTTDLQATFRDEFLAAHPPGTPLGDVLSAGGFVRYFRDHDIAPDTLFEIELALEQRFGDYAPTQGIRFRSSSTAEDIEGFSGAGLYDSNTGYFFPEAQAEERLHNRSIERAILKTWASYWSFEAFEERRLEQVDHLSGSMAVLVHARFDDPLERNNGVATVTLLPEGGEFLARIEINTQLGAVSVTNPDPDDPQLPEIIEVTVDRDWAYDVTVTQRSTLADDASHDTALDATILDAAAVDLLVEHLLAVADQWRSSINQPLDDAQRVSVVTLDFEFKTMDGPWPAGAGPDEVGLVLKQVRSLDPGLRGVPDSITELPIPRDVLARAASVVRVTCPTASGQQVVYEVSTDPLVSPDMGYTDDPWRSAPLEASSETCARTTIRSSPDAFLVGLFARPDVTRLLDS